MKGFLAVGFLEHCQRCIQLLAASVDNLSSFGALLLQRGMVLLSFSLAPIAQRHDEHGQ
ncbi:MULTISPECIES: hypothetical protein [Methylobacter]